MWVPGLPRHIVTPPAFPLAGVLSKCFAEETGFRVAEMSTQKSNTTDPQLSRRAMRNPLNSNRHNTSRRVVPACRHSLNLTPLAPAGGVILSCVAEEIGEQVGLLRLRLHETKQPGCQEPEDGAVLVLPIARERVHGVKPCSRCIDADASNFIPRVTHRSKQDAMIVQISATRIGLRHATCCLTYDQRDRIAFLNSGSNHRRRLGCNRPALGG
jgi:hypothetical protein